MKITGSIAAAALSLALVGCGQAQGEGPTAVTFLRRAQASSVSAGSGFDLQSQVSADAEPVVSEDGTVSQDVFAMDTYMTVKANGDRAAEAVAAAVAEIHRLDALLSTGRESSEISRLNRDGGGTVSADTEALLRQALALWEETDHAFDIAIYPVMQLWGFPTGDFRVPREEEIKQALARTDASGIVLDEQAHRVTFGEQGQEIDLGGIAKGYTSARIMDIFRAHGVTRGLVSLGGNVQTYGKKADGSAWKVGIEDPVDQKNYLGVLQASDVAVITSGGYERFFEQDGKRYHHIVDPATGYPADSGVLSSTIVSRDGTLADGLSTSLFIMGVDRAKAYWRAHSDAFDFILADSDGKLYVTEGIADQFTTERPVEVVHRDGD